MSKHKKKLKAPLSNKECLNKLIMASATLDCVIKALKGLKLNKTSEIVQESLEDILRVAATLQVAVSAEEAAK